MFVTDPGRGAIYVAASDDSGSFAGANFTALPLQNLMLPWAVAFDNRSRTIFWTDGDLDAILRANLDGTEQTVIVSGLGFPAGLAIDTVNDRLYWTDQELDIVGSSDLDGNDQNVLVNTGLVRPAGIAVSTRNRLLFWADFNTSTIERADTDGSNRMLLVSSDDLDYPTAVSLDYQEERVYWADFGLGLVESVNITGSDHRVHVQMVQGFSYIKPYGLALLGTENRIFYTDSTQTQSVILEIDQSREQVSTSINGSWNQFQGLRYIFISGYAGPLSEVDQKPSAVPIGTLPSTDSAFTLNTSPLSDPTKMGTTDLLDTPTTEVSPPLPTPTLIIIIAGASIIGILAVALVVALTIKTRRNEAQPVNKDASRSDNDVPATFDSSGRVPSYIDPHHPAQQPYTTLDPDHLQHEYDEQLYSYASNNTRFYRDSEHSDESETDQTENVEMRDYNTQPVYQNGGVKVIR